MSKGNIQTFSILFRVLAVICIIIGLILWISSAIVSKIDKHIKENKLVSTGVYAWVRNPIYSAFAFVFTGILFWQNNIFLLAFPAFFWITMTILVKAECNAHHIRNLKGIYENYGHEWSHDMAELLLELKRNIETLKSQDIDFMAPDDIQNYMQRYDEIIAKGVPLFVLPFLM